MFIIGALLFCFITFYWVFNRANTMLRSLTMYCIILPIIVVIAGTYYSKVSDYSYVSPVDFRMYIRLSRLPIPIRHLSTLYNLSIALYLAIGIRVISYFTKMKWWKILLFVVPLFGFVIWNYSSFIQTLNIRILLSPPDEVQILKSIYDALPGLNNLLLIVYTVLPFVFVVKSLFSTELHIKKQKAIFVIIFLVLTNWFLYQTLFLTFGNIYMNNVNIAKLPKNPANSHMSIVPSFLIFFALVVFLIVLWYYNPFRHYVHLTYKDMEKNNKRMSENAYASFHIYKNVFLSVHYRMDAVKKSLDAGQYDTAKKHIDAIDKTVEHQVEELSKSLQKLGDIKNAYQNINLCECLYAARGAVNIPSGIEVRIDCADMLYVSGNEYHLKEAFVNLIKNAVEALKNVKDRTPTIEILAFREDQLAVVRITDNGCGLPKKDTKKIFNLFYTTKARKVNSGIGLSYVQNVIHLHLGSIFVRSKEDSFTTFEIILPCAEE